MPRRMTYVQIAQDLADRIRSGEYKPDHALPTYRELAVLYGVGMTTISMSIAILKSQGLVEGEQGRGVFVAPAEPGPSV